MSKVAELLKRYRPEEWKDACSYFSKGATEAEIIRCCFGDKDIDRVFQEAHADILLRTSESLDGLRKSIETLIQATTSKSEA